MNQMDIYKQIQQNNNQIKYFCSPNEFTLNTIVSDLLIQNRQLQAQCNEIGHHFEDGICIYCMSIDPNYKDPNEQLQPAEGAKE